MRSHRLWQDRRGRPPGSGADGARVLRRVERVPNRGTLQFKGKLVSSYFFSLFAIFNI